MSSLKPGFTTLRSAVRLVGLFFLVFADRLVAKNFSCRIQLFSRTLLVVAISPVAVLPRPIMLSFALDKVVSDAARRR
jgi:hypothetical protein